jgi:hypothetical protein
MTRLLTFLLASLLSGCIGFAGSVVKSVVYPDHMGMSPSEYDAFITDSIEHDLKRELVGGRPTAGIKTWKEFWQWRYSLWRKYPDGEKWVTYTRSRRQQLGLRYI